MSKRVRTTVSLPGELLESVDRAVREGWAKSRNEFLSGALEREFEAMERTRIDKAFGLMADDPLYQEEAESVTEEFDAASWESLRSVEE